MQTSSVSVLGTQGQQNPTGKNAFNDVRMEEFLKLLIAELQNQDPLNPMSNQEMLQQINSIREIESNTRLTESLQALQLGQNMATASTMLGRVITGLSDNQTTVTGWVQRVAMVDQEPKLYVNGEPVSLKNVSEFKALRVIDEPLPAADEASTDGNASETAS